MNLSPEYKLLISCSKIKDNGNATSELQGLLRNSLNWPFILQGSINQGMPSLLYHNLLGMEDKVPENIWDNLKRIYYVNIYRNIRIYRQLNNILLSLHKEGLKVIPLKGSFLGEKIYNNIALRAMGDIDLLVKKEDLLKIDSLLSKMGYASPVNKILASRAIQKSYFNSIDYFKPDKRSASLHIHWHIVNVPLPTYLYTKNIKMEKFWECAEPTTLSDAPALQLAPHHLIMYLSEHALKHSFDKLILLSDIDAIIKRQADRINWQELIKESLAFDMKRQVYYSLYFTNYFLDTAIPDYVLTRLKPEKTNFLERRFFHSVRNNNRPTKLFYFAYLGAVKGITGKLRFIFRALFPPPCVVALNFNLDRPRVSFKDYFSFMRKQLRHLKNAIISL